MDIIISARHMALTGSMETNTREKLKHFSSHYTKLNKAEVVLDVSKKDFSAEIIIHGKGINLEAKASADNMYSAINLAAEKMEKQLQRVMGKKMDKHRHTKRPRQVEESSPELDEYEDYLEAVS